MKWFPLRRKPGKVAPTIDPEPQRPMDSVVRDWGIAHGYSVPERGAIPREVREAYDKAHPKQ